MTFNNYYKLTIIQGIINQNTDKKTKAPFSLIVKSIQVEGFQGLVITREGKSKEKRECLSLWLRTFSNIVIFLIGREGFTRIHNCNSESPRRQSTSLL